MEKGEALKKAKEKYETFLGIPVPNAPVPNAPVPNAPVPNAPALGATGSTGSTPVPNAPVSNAPVPNVPNVPNTFNQKFEFDKTTESIFKIIDKKITKKKQN